MAPIDLDALLRLIADRRRRRLVELLRRRGDEQTTVDELVDRLDRGGRPAATEPPRNRVELGIWVYHTQLPKLADAGLVEYDHDRGTVQYLSDERLEALMDSLPEDAPVLDP